MKTFITILPVLAATTILASAGETLNFLRQTHYDSVVIWDVPIDTSGSIGSPLGVGDKGSVYELWSLDSTGNMVEMDREVVSTYNANFTVRFETGDPYSPVPRTRVDQPFTAHISVRGLDGAPDTGSGEYLKKLSVVHQGFLFPTMEYTMDDVGGLNEPQIIRQFEITGDGDYAFQFPMTNLSGSDITKTFGAEFMVITSPDRYNQGHGNNVDGVDIDNNGNFARDLDIILADEVVQGKYVVGNIFEWAMVQIWPIAEATINGIEPGRTYQYIPDITVDLQNLYPDSRTYLRYYKGLPTSNPADPVEVGQATVVINDATPQDKTLATTILDDLIDEDGVYTVEVLHETPFGTDILAQVSPLKVDRDITFRGNLNAGGL